MAPLCPLAAVLLLLFGPVSGRVSRDHGLHPNSVYSGLDQHRPRDVRAGQDLRTFYQTGVSRPSARRLLPCLHCPARAPSSPPSP
jgi:hypothetical protein